MNIKTILVAGLILLSIPAPVFARNYSVEAIIFANPQAPDATTVDGKDKAPRIIRAQNKLNNLYRQAAAADEAREQANIRKSSNPQDPAPGPDADEDIALQLSTKLVALKSIRDKLEANPDYQILQTLSWQQSEANYKDSPSIKALSPHMKGVIRVYAPNLLFTQLNLTYVPDEVLPESLEQNLDPDSINPVPVPADTPGMVTPYTTINNSATFSMEPETKAVVTRYFIDERRKLKLNEIHYFDHPRFGVILSVKPVEDSVQEAS